MLALAPKITAMIAASRFYYEHTGDWMYTSGIPAKTGVGGGVMAYYPDNSVSLHSLLLWTDRVTL